ncbi:MAG: peptide deformylase [Verrucomicrobia bacterium]|nr:peptide deformylase [Cytophagales bacterium]
MILPIVAYGDPILKKTTQNVEKGKTDLKRLAEDMFETMYNAKGVGLAAPQIGLSLRVFVIDAELLDDEDENLKGLKKVFVNAKILEETGETWSFEEGCLSIPGIRGEVIRPEKLTINYFDTDWNEFTETYEGLAARVIQHEYDHIEGKLFIDYLTPMKKQVIKNKLINIIKGDVKVEYRMRFPK